MSNAPTTTQKTSNAILEALGNLIQVVAKLRSPSGGCPWDLAQTPQTLIPYVIEEAYEVVHALKSENKEAISEELGDLLLQVVLQAQIASETGDFSLQEVAEGITAKLIRRHPHVFGNLAVETAEEVRRNWEQIKAEEKGETAAESHKLSPKLTRYAQTLPPLMAASKISRQAAKVGFEWDNIEGVWEKFEEELEEFREALKTETKIEQQAELGDLLFTLVNIARWYGLDCMMAVQGTNEKFIYRFSQMEAFADQPLSDYTLDELEQLWQQAKLTNNKL